MEQIKLFKGTEIDKLEEEANKWLAEKKKYIIVKDIKLAMGTHSYTNFAILISFTEIGS
jgi:hypothetical protein